MPTCTPAQYRAPLGATGAVVLPVVVVVPALAHSAPVPSVLGVPPPAPSPDRLCVMRT
ncbi:hypothetical protein ACL02T_08795 [Pseudonocardia sp. RS010]|uniref:hypothetical protein n=1 Tax=Pseudonocardia sp. RS010 TaxID=3385979 RepID=UPI0039A3C59A